MTETTQEIRDDYWIDDEDNIFVEAFGDDIDRLNSDIKQGNILEVETTQLLDAALAVESHGINAAAFFDVHKANLLAGTAFADVALETLGNAPVDSAESEMALEAIMDSVKAKLGEWADKILKVAGTLATKVHDVLGSLWTKISDQVKTLGSKAWDKTKAAGHTIKAHPYKTIFAALTAAAAVAAIIGYTATGTYANESALQSFMYKIKDMVDAIKWPWGKPNIEIIHNGTKILYRVEEGGRIDLISKTPLELGWTQAAVKSIGGQAGRVWTALKSGIGAVSTKVVSIAKTINNIGDPGAFVKEKTTEKTGSAITGWISQQVANKAIAAALWGVIGVLMKLLTNIVAKSFKETKDTLNALNPVAQTA